MYQKINQWAAKLQGFADRAKYIYELVTWGLDAVRSISDILSRFPKPVNHKTDESESIDNSKEHSGAVPVSDAKGNGGEVPEPVK